MVAAYEQRIEALENEKLVIREKLQSSGQPKSTIDESPRTAMAFLANPGILWASGLLEDRRTVMKLVFGARPAYHRKEGVRTVELSMPFKALDSVLSRAIGGVGDLARPRGIEPLFPP